MSNENKSIANSIKEQTYYKGKTAEVRKWAFASGELVYNLPWMLISSFLAFFMTDIALIPAQTVAILFLVCRIWDAVNDPMIGSMADRTKSKMGRYRPWMLGGAVCLMPIVVLLFTAHPSWSVGARTTYACVLYALAVIAATAWNIPFSALNGVISPYPNERASFSSHRIFVSSIACAATNAMFLPLVNRFSEQGGKTQGYSMAALTICLLTVPFIFTSILGTKEVVKAPPSQKMGTKQVLGNFFKNPPLLIVCTAFLVYGFLNYGRMTAGMYYFTYFWGDTGLFSIYAPINGIICAVSAFFSGYIIKLCRGKRGALLFCYGTSFVLNSILFFLNPSNSSPSVVIALLFCAGVMNGFCTSILYGMIGDTVEYGQWKTGARADGLSSSGTSFMMKLGGAIAPTMLLSLLEVNGYAAGAQTQTDGALNAINITMNLIPAGLALLSFVIFFFYKLDDKLHAKIIDDLKERGEYIVD